MTKNRMRKAFQGNGDSALRASLLGHSHMDTAWLWPTAETLSLIHISLMKEYGAQACADCKK